MEFWISSVLICAWSGSRLHLLLRVLGLQGDTFCLYHSPENHVYAVTRSVFGL